MIEAITKMAGGAMNNFIADTTSGAVLPDTINGALLLSVIDFFLSFFVISFIGFVLAMLPLLNRLGPGISAKIQHQLPPASARVDMTADDHIAAISAAIAVIGAHRIAHIEQRIMAGGGWRKVAPLTTALTMLAVTGHPVHHACTLRVQRISRHFCPNIGPGAFPGATGIARDRRGGPRPRCKLRLSSGSPWGWSLMACRYRSGAGGHNCPQRHNFGLYGSNKLNLQGRADRGAQKRSMLRFWMVWADRRRGRSGPSNVIRLSSSAFGSRPRACLGPNGQRGRLAAHGRPEAPCRDNYPHPHQKNFRARKSPKSQASASASTARANAMGFFP